MEKVKEKNIFASIKDFFNNFFSPDVEYIDDNIDLENEELSKEAIEELRKSEANIEELENKFSNGGKSVKNSNKIVGKSKQTNTKQASTKQGNISKDTLDKMIETLKKAEKGEEEEKEI